MNNLVSIIACFISFIFTVNQCFSQGKFLLVGGGTERYGANSWSTPPYTFAAQGKKVAIIGTSSGTLAAYFKNQCGARYAKEFVVTNSQQANSQELYDSLITYEMIFFKGGDQWEYYVNYKNTLLLNAVVEIFAKGGVVGGTSAGLHILSGVVFTAQNGTVYPYECIENPDNQYITLANDFLPFFPGYIFDSHLAERGRMARLPGFMARWYFDHNLLITGLGIDDLTCMYVDEGGIGTVWGTGAVTIFYPQGNFGRNGKKLLSDSIRMVQLLKGCTFNFSTGECTFTSLNQNLPNLQLSSGLKGPLLASGSNTVFENQSMLEALIYNYGQLQDSILIVAGSESVAKPFKDKLITLGAKQVAMLILDNYAGNSVEAEKMIMQSKKVLWLGNTYEKVIAFSLSPNGRLILHRMREGFMIPAFVGDDSRWVGKTVVENFYTPGASYYGELVFRPGWSLLRYSVIMPNSYYNANIYENSMTAVPYAMILDSLKWGIWLTHHNFLKLDLKNDSLWLGGEGTAPVLLLLNDSEKGGFSSQTSTGSTTSSPRQVAGFDNMKLFLLDDTRKVFLSRQEPLGGIKNMRHSLRISFDRLTCRLSIHGLIEPANLEVYNLNATKFLETALKAGENYLPLKVDSGNIYILVFRFTDGKVVSKKLLIL